MASLLSIAENISQALVIGGASFAFVIPVSHSYAEPYIAAIPEAKSQIKLKPKYYVGCDNMLSLTVQSPPLNQWRPGPVMEAARPVSDCGLAAAEIVRRRVEAVIAGDGLDDAKTSAIPNERKS